MITIQGLQISDSVQDFSYHFNDKGLYTLSHSNIIYKAIYNKESTITFNKEKITQESLTHFYYIHKNPGLVTTLTVSENLNLLCGDSSEIYTTVDQFLSLGVLTKDPLELTRVETILIHIVIALLKKSKVILVEDVFNGLNTESKLRILKALNILSKDALVLVGSDDLLVIQESIEYVNSDSSYINDDHKDKHDLEKVKPLSSKLLLRYMQKDRIRSLFKLVLYASLSLCMLSALYIAKTDDKIITSLSKDNIQNRQEITYQWDDPLLDEYRALEDTELVVNINNPAFFKPVEAENEEEEFFTADPTFHSLPSDYSKWHVNASIYIGQYPSEANEVLIGTGFADFMIEDLGLDVSSYSELLDETVSFNFIDKDYDFKVVGVVSGFDYDDYKYLQQSDNISNFDYGIFFHKQFSEDLLLNNSDVIEKEYINYTLYFNDFNDLYNGSKIINSIYFNPTQVLYSLSPKPLYRHTTLYSLAYTLSLFTSIILLFFFIRKQFLNSKKYRSNLSIYSLYGYSKLTIRKNLMISKTKDLGVVLFAVLLSVINVVLITELFFMMDFITIPYFRGSLIFIFSITSLIFIVLLLLELLIYTRFKFKTLNETLL